MKKIASAMGPERSRPTVPLPVPHSAQVKEPASLI